jgi:signal transduction histidine kinase
MVLKEHGGPLTDKQKKMLQEAERSCERISALVGEMSELGKLESQQLSIPRQEIDLAALLRDVASDMHEGEDRGVRLDVRLPNRPVTVTGDRTRLSAAITTLLYAALRERGEPGIIVAECSVLDGSP